MTDANAQHVVLTGVAFLVTLGAVWAGMLALVGIVRGFRKMSRLLDDFIGSPDSPGVLDRLRMIEDHLREIEGKQP